MQNKTKTTINLDSNILKAIKLVALNKDTTQTEIIQEYLKQGLINEQNINKKNKSLDEIVGIFKEDKPSNSVEEVKN